jgi:hypothetical protein
LSLAGCEVRQTKEAKAPDVDVTVKEGQLPEYEVETPDVQVKKGTAEVPYPDVDIEVEKKTAQVPYPDVDVITPSEKREQRGQN